MTPTTEADLAGAVAAAEAPFHVQGGGTRGVEAGGNVLSTAALSGIELYEPGALTIVLKAGTPVSEVEAALAKENQRLAFEPMDHRGLMGTTGVPTIGGVVAANVSGPRRIQAGACRDFLLGVRYVDGRGTIIKNGGRVMKNVTGYDLVKLMAGSWGTLGVLTEVALKVLPRSDTQATLVMACADTSKAVDAMSKALGSPFEVTGSAFDPRGGCGAAGVLLRIEGFESSVRYRSQQVSELLSGAVEVIEDPAASAALWQKVRDVATFHGVEGDVWRLSVKPTDAPAICERMAADDLLLDWGGGLIWARVPTGTDLRARLGAFGGHATLVQAAKETKARLGMFQPEAAAVAALSESLRRKFDPKGLFNPGLMQSPVEA